MDLDTNMSPSRAEIWRGVVGTLLGLCTSEMSSLSMPLALREGG